MKHAGIGIRVHSGWGALVVVAGLLGAEEIVERRRVVVADKKRPGTIQPYHFAERMGLTRAEQHVAQCASKSAELAVAALGHVLQELRAREYSVTGCCILLSSGRALPDLGRILASHALIHAAEGEFFRSVFRRAFEHLEIPVTGIRERELSAHAEGKFGKAAAPLRDRIAAMGHSLGPPWTADQKAAALAGFLVLG